MEKSFFASVIAALHYGIEHYAEGKLKRFAEQVGIYQPTMYRWLHGNKCIPNLEDIGKVMDFLGVTINCPWEQEAPLPTNTGSPSKDSVYLDGYKEGYKEGFESGLHYKIPPIKK